MHSAESTVGTLPVGTDIGALAVRPPPWRVLHTLHILSDGNTSGGQELRQPHFTDGEAEARGVWLSEGAVPPQCHRCPSDGPSCNHTARQSSIWNLPLG